MKRNTKPGRTSQNPVFNATFAQEHRTPASNYHRSRPADTRHSDSGTRSIDEHDMSNVQRADDDLLMWV